MHPDYIGTLKTIAEFNNAKTNAWHPNDFKAMVGHFRKLLAYPASIIPHPHYDEVEAFMTKLGFSEHAAKTVAVVYRTEMVGREVERPTA